MDSYIIDGMYAAIKDHFHGFSDASVKLALRDYWKDKIAIVWALDDVFSALNQNRKAISYASAQHVLREAFHRHDAEVGVSWEVLSTHCSSLGLPFSRLTREHADGDVWFVNQAGKVVEWKGNPNE